MLVLALVVLLGCPGNDTTPPEIHVNLITLSAPDASGLVTVVGEAGAITDDSPPITCVARNDRTLDLSAETKLQPDGGFMARVPALPGDGISVKAWDGEGNESIWVPAGAVPGPGEPPPVVVSYEPGFGIAGTVVTVHGTGFGDDPRALHVAFESGAWSVEVPVLETTEDMARFHVPARIPVGMAEFFVVRAGRGESGPHLFEVVSVPALFERLEAQTNGAFERGETANAGMEEALCARLRSTGDSCIAGDGNAAKAKIENLQSLVQQKTERGLLQPVVGARLAPHLDAAGATVSGELDLEPPAIDEMYIRVSSPTFPEDQGVLEVFVCGGPCAVWEWQSGNASTLIRVVSPAGSAVVYPSLEGSFWTSIQAAQGDPISITATDLLGNVAELQMVVPPGGPDIEAPVFSEQLVLIEPPLPSDLEPMVRILGGFGAVADRTFPVAYAISNLTTGDVVTGLVTSGQGAFDCQIPGESGDTIAICVRDPSGNEAGPFDLCVPPPPTKKEIFDKLKVLFATRVFRLTLAGEIAVDAKDIVTKKMIEDVCRSVAEEMKQHYPGEQKGSIMIGTREVPVVVATGPDGGSGADRPSGNGHDGKAGEASIDTPGSIAIGMGGNGGPGVGESGAGGKGGAGTATATGYGSVAVGIGGGGAQGSGTGEGGTGGPGTGTTQADGSTSVGTGGGGGQGGTGIRTDERGKGDAGKGGDGGPGDASSTGENGVTALADGGNGGQGGMVRVSQAPGPKPGKGGKGGPANAKAGKKGKGANNAAGAQGGNGGPGGIHVPPAPQPPAPSPRPPTSGEGGAHGEGSADAFGAGGTGPDENGQNGASGGTWWQGLTGEQQQGVRNQYP